MLHSMRLNARLGKKTMKDSKNEDRPRKRGKTENVESRKKNGEVETKKCENVALSFGQV